MAFELNDHETHINLVFEDYPDLHVKVREMSTESFLAILPMANMATDINPRDAQAVAGLGDVFRELTDMLGAQIAEWDVERSGVPVPPSAEAVRRLPFSMVQAFLVGFMQGMGGVAGPLDEGSTPSAMEADIPMTPLPS